MSERLSEHILHNIGAAAKVLGGGITNRAKVWLVLVAYANAEGRAWPSIDTIQAESGVHRWTVQQELQALCHLGAIDRDGLSDHNGRKRSNAYRVTVPGYEFSKSEVKSEVKSESESEVESERQTERAGTIRPELEQEQEQEQFRGLFTGNRPAIGGER